MRDVSDTSCFGNQLIDHFGRQIHPASYSRKAELNYLRGIVTAIIPYLLPAIHVSTNNKVSLKRYQFSFLDFFIFMIHVYQKSLFFQAYFSHIQDSLVRSFYFQVILREILANWILLPAIDAIADPDNINALVVLSTHRDGSVSSQVDTVNVPMLQYWITIPITSKIMQNRLKPSLDEILNDPRLLYMFMQHIKETGPMNLFQFCLDIGKCIFCIHYTKQKYWY